MAVRNYINGAPPQFLETAVDTDDLVLEVDSTDGYPEPPFILTLERALPNQEVVLCTAKAATTFTVTRGWDGTDAVVHAIGAVLEHTSAAVDFVEANVHVNASTDVHSQYLLKSAFAAKGTIMAASAAGVVSPLAVGANDLALVADSTAAGGVAWKQITLDGIAGSASAVVASANTLIKRDASGRAQVASPSVSADIATRGYADALGTSVATSSTIMRRDSNGRARVTYPSASTDIAVAQYVLDIQNKSIGAAGGSLPGLAYVRANGITYAYCTAELTVGTGTYAGTIPSGFRPASTIYYKTTNDHKDPATNGMEIRFLANGTIEIAHLEGGSSAFMINAHWPHA